MPKIDLSRIPFRTGSSYPAPHDQQMAGRRQQGLGDAAGLTQFGANRVELAPGAMSSLRHWHEQQDEFLVVTEGALVLIDDHGETPLSPGDCCAFPAGDANGHHIVNRSDATGAFVVVGTRTETEVGWYSDLDMKVTAEHGKMTFFHRDGTAFGTHGTLPELDFPALSEKLTRALMTRDAALYAQVFHIPHEVVPRQGKPYRIETEAALVEDLNLYAEALRLNHTTDVYRKVVSERRPARDLAEVSAEVDFLSGANRIVAPMEVTFQLRAIDGAWKIVRVESTLGHINWTLGNAGILPDGEFGEN